MAEIPVERKEGSSFPWWLIPLLLLLLLLPLLYFCSKSNVVDNTNNNTNSANVGTATNANNRVGSANTGTNTMAANTGNTAVVVNNNSAANSGAMNANSGAGDRSVIKDVNEFGGAGNKASLVGRGFFVNGVRVNRVLSDNVFTVKSGSGEMFVLLDNNLDSPGGKEGQIKMKPGQNVNLGGEFRNVPSGEVNAETKKGGLDGKEYAQMKGQQVYLHATSVEDAK
jgi:hypothetical protein